MRLKVFSAFILLTLLTCIVFPCFAKDTEENVYVWAETINENAVNQNTTNQNTTSQNVENRNTESKNEVNTNAKNSNAIPTNEVTEDTATEVADNNFLNLESGSAILIEQTTGQVLYSHNSHEQLRPASVTKIMSILLIMEQIEKGALSYDDKIPCSENASAMGGSQIWLDTTETLTVEEMLKAICVVSANDCVVQL